jgi:hypothetical protein
MDEEKDTKHREKIIDSERDEPKTQVSSMLNIYEGTAMTSMSSLVTQLSISPINPISQKPSKVADREYACTIQLSDGRKTVVNLTGRNINCLTHSIIEKKISYGSPFNKKYFSDIHFSSILQDFKQRFSTPVLPKIMEITVPKCNSNIPLCSHNCNVILNDGTEGWITLNRSDIFSIIETIPQSVYQDEPSHFTHRHQADILLTRLFSKIHDVSISEDPSKESWILV